MAGRITRLRGASVVTVTAVGVAAVVAVPAVAAPAATTGARGEVPASAVYRYRGMSLRVSVTSSGREVARRSTDPAVSADGRWVAFSSASKGLVPGDTNGRADVFLHDRRTAVTRRVSLASTGAQARGTSGAASVSGDGRFVAFTSTASNLVPGDTNGVTDVFVRDLRTGRTERVDVGVGGRQADRPAYAPSISDDGRLVAFSSAATDLVTGDTNGVADVFVRDRSAHRTVRVSVGGHGVQGDAASTSPDISGDGRHVAFASAAGTLVAGDTNGRWDVFVRSLVSGTTRRASVADDGSQSTSASVDPAISTTGRYVAYVSTPTLPAEDATATRVMRRDLVARATVTSSLTHHVGAVADRRNLAPSISGDGRLVAFVSDSRTVIPGGADAPGEVFVRDHRLAETLWVTTDSRGARSWNAASAAPAFNGSGRYLAFTSVGQDLVPQDRNGVQDVFLRDRWAPMSEFGDVLPQDGLPDVLARQRSSGVVWSYPGDGRRTLSKTFVTWQWDGIDLATRVIGLPGQDQVAARRRSNGHLWLCDARGGIATRRDLGPGWGAMRDIAGAGDLDGDGRPDLLAVRASTGSLELYDLDDARATRRMSLGTGWNAFSELTGVGDLDHDGHPDVVARKDATGELFLFRGTGSGAGTRLRGGVRLGTGWDRMRDLVGIGDFTRDGWNDLVAVDAATGRLMLYRGNGTGLLPRTVIGTGFTTDLQPLF